MVSQLVGALVKLMVGELRILEDQGNGVGCAFYLFLEQLVDGAVPGVGCLSIVPRDQELMTLELSQKRQFANRLIRIDPYSVQQHLEVLHHASDRVAVKQIKAVRKLGR